MRLLLDANLAVLLVIGLADRKLISRHKRLQNYDRRDFEFLKAYVARCESVEFIPNTLTETANLIVQGVTEPLRSRVLETLRTLIEESAETYVASTVAAGRYEFRRLGLTDAALIAVCEPQTILLTDDDALYAAASLAGLQARNFRHFQAER